MGKIRDGAKGKLFQIYNCFTCGLIALLVHIRGSVLHAICMDVICNLIYFSHECLLQNYSKTTTVIAIPMYLYGFQYWDLIERQNERKGDGRNISALSGRRIQNDGK
jgi:hypothetical protein